MGIRRKLTFNMAVNSLDPIEYGSNICKSEFPAQGESDLMPWRARPNFFPNPVSPSSNDMPRSSSYWRIKKKSTIYEYLRDLRYILKLNAQNKDYKFLSRRCKLILYISNKIRYTTGIDTRNRILVCLVVSTTRNACWLTLLMNCSEPNCWTTSDRKFSMISI